MASFQERLGYIEKGTRQALLALLNDGSFNERGENPETIAMLLRNARAAGMTSTALAGALTRPVAEVQNWTSVGIERGHLQFEVVGKVREILLELEA